MDTEAIIKQTRARFDHNRNKQILKEKYEAKMLFAHSGGMWKAGPELLTLLQALTTDEAVLVDEYDTPCKVNVQEMKLKVEQYWNEQLNAWLEEYNQLRRNR